MEFKPTELLIDITSQINRNKWLEEPVEFNKQYNQLTFKTNWRYVYYNSNKTLTT